MGDDVSAEQVQEFLRRTEPIAKKIVFDPKVPTALKQDELVEILEAAAPVLVMIFASPEAAANVVDESFEQLFARLDVVDQSLDRIEKGILALEKKHDADTLARFRAGLRELRDGIRARRPSFREQLLLSARTKLTEIAELPSGLEYAKLPSQMLAAAACYLIAIVDTWSGELESACRYNLRGLVADPLWMESCLPPTLIHSLAGPALHELEQERREREGQERDRVHDFFWQKVGVGVVAGLGALIGGGSTAGPAIATAARSISRLGTPEAQQEAREKAIEALTEQAALRRAEILRTAALERLTALGD